MSSRQMERRWRMFSLLLLVGVLVSAHAGAKEKTASPNKDEACLACHGTAGMKSGKGKDISINPAKHSASAHGVLGCTDCHTSIKEFPHPAKIAKVQCSSCHDSEAKAFTTSVHAMLGEDACSSCHGNVHELTTTERLAPAKCAECHAQEIKEFTDSVHGQAAAHNDPDAPKCASCHGSIHEVKASGEAGSMVAAKQLPDTCAKCHSDPGFLSRHQLPVAHPVDSYKQSVHGREIAAGDTKAAKCNDCHGNHDIYPARDARSRVNHWKVSETCANCHKEIAKVYQQSVHGEAVRIGAKDAPVCTDCHGEHLILEPKNPKSPVNAANVSVETCGRCHSSPRLALLYDMPAIACLRMQTAITAWR